MELCTCSTSGSICFYKYICGLLAMNSTSLHVCGNVFILPSFLVKDLLDSRILDSQSPRHPSILSVPFHCLLLSLVLYGKSAVNLIVAPLHI